MPAPNRRFVHQQDTTRPGPATLRHPSRLRADQAHDPMPPHPVMAGHRPNRHHPRICHQATSEPAGEASLELVVVLEVTLPTVPTAEPATTPNQGGATAAHPQVTNPLRPPVPHPKAAEPTMAAPRPLPSRFHFDLEAVNRIHPHPPHANTRQVQTNRHNIRHRGLSWIRRSSQSPIPARPHPQSKDFNPPNPQFRAGPP